MPKNRTLLTIAFALFLASTSPAKEKAEPAAVDYFPLRVGHSWTYRNDSDGSEYTLKVINEEKQSDGGIRWVVEKLAEVKVLTTYSKAKGWVFMHEERYPEHEGLEAKYEGRQYLPDPLVAGIKWEWKGKDYTQTDVHEKNEVVGLEEVTVKAGKFRAMKVVSEVSGGSARMTRTYWYADGVGLVKSTTDGGTIKYGSELADYSFKEKNAK